ncbi:MAG: hypothetical protein O2812_02380 [Chloroflexi bacterium]|nr:hypothetical protein [Chloroflexota bacterium]
MATYSYAQGTQSFETRQTDMTGMQRMASKMWAPWIVMGLMMVLIAFIIGLVLQDRVGFWFSFPKAERDAAVAGTDIVSAKAFIEATKVWLPAFKFLGLGMMLGGITFLLATILGTLRPSGAAVQRALGADVKLYKPAIANVFPVLMMMVMIAALVIGIVMGVQANDLYSNSIATIDSAPSGSELLAQLGRINAVTAWLAPFKFVGMALLFSGIATALVTIIYVLRWQSRRVLELVGQ